MGLRRGRPPSGEQSPRRGAISRGPCLRDGRTRGAPGRLWAAGYEQASSLLLPPRPQPPHFLFILAPWTLCCFP